MGYAELHCHTNFSFLDGASHPEELVDEAVRLGLTGLAVTDHNGFYGIVRFAVAAKSAGLPTVFGTELTLLDGSHLVVLAEGPVGHARLAGAISRGQLAGEKEAPRFDLATLAEGAGPRCTSRETRRVGRTRTGSCSRGVARARCRVR